MKRSCTYAQTETERKRQRERERERERGGGAELGWYLLLCRVLIYEHNKEPRVSRYGRNDNRLAEGYIFLLHAWHHRVSIN